MATKISELTAASAVTTDDLIPIVDDPSGTPTTKKATAEQVLAFGDARTATLTNKTISGASNTVSNLAASAIASGTLAHERGGLEADVSAYSGLVKIAAGTTSAVTAPSGTIVGDTDSQTLTNKTISGASNTISALAASVITSGTLSHERGGLEADVSVYDGLVKISAGTTSAVTAPSGTIVGTSDSQTLTNKTISGASNTVELAASDITSGALVHERGGLEADVSAYDGLVKITGGATSAVTAPAGAVVGTTDTQTLTNKTLTSPTINGASSATSNDNYGTETNYNPASVQTTDATVTTVASFTIASNSAVTVSALVTAIKSDSTAAASYSVQACFRNAGGSVSQVGTTTTTTIGEDVAGWDATIDNSTTTVRVRVTGAAATTVRWTCILTRLTVVP